jgi:hypothetical protein
VHAALHRVHELPDRHAIHHARRAAHAPHTAAARRAVGRALRALTAPALHDGGRAPVSGGGDEDIGDVGGASEQGWVSWLGAWAPSGWGVR